MLNLDSVEFDTTHLELLGDSDGVRSWRTVDNDHVSLHFFPVPPDIPAALNDVVQLRRGYVRGAGSSVSVIYVDSVSVASRPGLRVIVRTPQEPSGMTYIGSITLPYRDCSFVVKAQCAEEGMTGVREAVVMDELAHSSGTTLDAIHRAWRLQPEDPLGRTALPRNLAEHEDYDRQFPTHPLSRLRQVLRTVQDSVTLAPELVELEPFEYHAPSRDRWSKRRTRPGGSFTDTFVAVLSKITETIFGR